MARDIESLEDFVTRIAKTTEPLRTSLYRGHSQTGWSLKPSIFRKPTHARQECNVIREIISKVPHEFTGDDSLIERLVRMQHYKVPTRLLDVTFNPLVALYFACCDNLDEDGQFITIRVKKHIVKYYDSDTVSCLANLANLNQSERTAISSCKDDYLFRESPHADRLVQFIRSEKPHFRNAIVRSDLDGPLVIKPKLANRRIVAQNGAFFVFGLNEKLEKSENIDVVRANIPQSIKANIKKQLDKFGFNLGSLFPEIESAAKYIMDNVISDDGSKSEKLPTLILDMDE